MGKRRDHREFLTYLWQTQVDLSQLRSRRGRHPLEDEYEYHWRQLADAMRLVRAIHVGVEPDALKEEFVGYQISAVENALRFNNNELETAGVLAILDTHFQALMKGLSVDNLPPEEADALRAGGFTEIADHLNGYITAARSAGIPRRGPDSVGRLPSNELRWAERTLDETSRAYRALARPSDDQPSAGNGGRKSRRWFKGLGQIIQGTAMSVADIGLATGCFHLPVSAETQTWGSLTSIIAGVGTIMNGAGDLRGE